MPFYFPVEPDLVNIYILCIAKTMKESNFFSFSPEKLETDSDLPEPISLERNLLMIVGGLSAMILFYILGASMFIIWEDWSLFNAFYFCFVTMTTIGFGDMTPSISGKGKY